MDLLNSILLLLSFMSSIVSPILSAAGVIRKKPFWLIVSAVLVVPFAIYFGRSNLPMGFWILLPLLQLGAAAAVHKHVTWLAWLFLMPLIGVISVLWMGTDILVIIIFVFIGWKLILYLINSILKDRNRVIFLFVSIILFILLNIITVIADESDLFNMLFMFFVILPNKYLIELLFPVLGANVRTLITLSTYLMMLLFPVLIYLGRNRIRSTTDSILKSNTKKNIVSLILIASLVLFINATFKHFFWNDILIGHLVLSGPPYDRIILLLVPIIFPLLAGFEIWNKTRNISDALLA